ncbi:hypothetical protein HYV71_03640 [Candidatus Uhrbacteria bacterium]|nr:hypothetical protein [Candidatus Uhrbacteria bacterium]
MLTTTLSILLIFTMILWSWVQARIYKTIKERHPAEYEKLEHPRFWKMWNPGYTAILYGTIKFPDDPALRGVIIGFRILSVILVIMMLTFAGINFFEASINLK